MGVVVIKKFILLSLVHPSLRCSKGISVADGVLDALAEWAQ